MFLKTSKPTLGKSLFAVTPTLYCANSLLAPTFASIVLLTGLAPLRRWRNPGNRPPSPKCALLESPSPLRLPRALKLLQLHLLLLVLLLLLLLLPSQPWRLGLRLLWPAILSQGYRRARSQHLPKNLPKVPWGRLQNFRLIIAFCGLAMTSASWRSGTRPTS